MRNTSHLQENNIIMEDTTTFSEVIPDEMYVGKVKASMEKSTYFKDSMQRIKELEEALLWCSGANAFKGEAEKAFITTVRPLLLESWF